MRIERISDPTAHAPDAPLAPSAFPPGPFASERPQARRRSRAQGRARRHDAWPATTARDVAALRFVGEQYAVRTDVLAAVLGRLSPGEPRAAGQLGPRTLRQRLARWEEAGWVVRRRLLGEVWVLPTQAGLRLAGLDFDPWQPSVPRLAHHHAVALVRLAREPVPGTAGWVSERELWRRRGKAKWHLADGALPVPVPETWQAQGIGEAWELVEVELHQKTRQRMLAALKTRPPHTVRVTYYAPPELVDPLSNHLASIVRELGGRPNVSVAPLPEVPGATYGGAA